MQPDVSEPVEKKNRTYKSSNVGISDAVIITAFTLICVSIVFNFMSDYSQPPQFDNFADYTDQNQAYQNAVEEHTDKMSMYEGIYELCSNLGLVLLVAGLFFKTTNGSKHLPDWVRVAMMAGVLYFLTRVFTSELSLMDQITLLGLLS